MGRMALSKRTTDSALWPLLVVAGLLVVPVECVRIGHPHSIFQRTGAAAAAPLHTHPDGTAHAASHHAGADELGTGTIPGWATPAGDVVVPPMRSLGASAQQIGPWPSHVAVAAPASRSLGVQVVLADTGDDLPRVEPALMTAVAALGAAVALLAGVLLLPVGGRCRVGVRCVALRGLLDRALDPPPPRTAPFAC